MNTSNTEVFDSEVHEEFSKLSEKQIKMIVAKVLNAFETKDDLIEFMKCHDDQLGVVFTDNSDKFIRIARMEKTPSCSVYEGTNYVKWHDHGSGVGGSIINLVEKNFEVDYKISAFYVYKLIGGEDIKASSQKTYKPKPKVYAPLLTEEDFESLNSVRAKHYHDFMKIMGDWARTIKDEKKMIKLVKYLDITYQNIPFQKFSDGGNIPHHRAILPELNEKDELVGFYAYNKNPEPYFTKDKITGERKKVQPAKGLIRTSQRPNLTGAHFLKTWNPSLPIILAEGHTDFVNLIGNGYRAITVGAATKTIKPFLPLLKGRIIHIWYDDDLPGIKGTESIMNEILDFNNSVTLKDRIIFKPMFWSLEVDSETPTKENRGKLFTPQKKTSIMTKFQVGKENIFWGTRKKKGYDFTDLLLEINDMEPALATKIRSYLSQYKKEEPQESIF